MTMIIVFVLVMIAGAFSYAQADWDALRRQMVDAQIRARDIRSEAVLQAMTRVPRHLFVPQALRAYAYEDRPLPIGQGQTISQPYIVGYMTDVLQLEPSHNVLEIGTGSGYQSAVLAHIVRQVYSIEIVPELAEAARRALADSGFHNVDVRTGDGYRGWPEHAPFDRIIVTAAPPQIPDALVAELAVGGIMVVPVGTDNQEIVIITRTAKGVTEKRTIGVKFVPMAKRNKE